MPSQIQSDLLCYVIQFKQIQTGLNTFSFQIKKNNANNNKVAHAQMKPNGSFNNYVD